MGPIYSSEPDDVTAFFDAVLAIRDNNFEKAQQQIDNARENVVPVLSSMLGDFSYSRAHRCMVTVQQLSELEVSERGDRAAERKLN